MSNTYIRKIAPNKLLIGHFYVCNNFGDMRYSFKFWDVPWPNVNALDF